MIQEAGKYSKAGYSDEDVLLYNYATPQNEIVSSFIATKTGIALSFTNNSLTKSLNINSDGISILQNVYIKNNTTNYPLNIDYNDTNIFKLTNDGKMTISSGIQINGIDGLELYAGVFLSTYY